MAGETRVKNKETTLTQNPAMLAIGGMPDVLAWRQQSGLFYTKNGTPVRVGVPGLADCGMVVAVKVTPEMVGKTIGVAVQAEFKTASGRQEPYQKLWQAAVEKRGGIYSVVRSADDMLALVESVRAGCCTQNPKS
jgi:hypothetical protein